LAGEKPTAAFALSLIGGIFILLDGILLAVVGSAISFGGIAGASTAGGIVTALGAIGLVFGLIIIIGGIMMYQKPQSHTMWGVIILVLSLISIVTGGGFIIGLILGLIGGILALVFKPSMGPTMMPGQPMGSMPMGTMGSMGTGAPMGQMGMTCKNCGASIPAGATRCPSCGASL
jgi:uncharacterized protein DUF6114/zinc ribbon protein